MTPFPLDHDERPQVGPVGGGGQGGDPRGIGDGPHLAHFNAALATVPVAGIVNPAGREQRFGGGPKEQVDTLEERWLILPPWSQL